MFLLLGGILAPRWPKMAPSWPQEAPRWPMMGPRGPFLGPVLDREVVDKRKRRDRGSLVLNEFIIYVRLVGLTYRWLRGYMRDDHQAGMVFWWTLLAKCFAWLGRFNWWRGAFGDFHVDTGVGMISLYVCGGDSLLNATQSGRQLACSILI